MIGWSAHIRQCFALPVNIRESLNAASSLIPSEASGK